MFLFFKVLLVQACQGIREPMQQINIPYRSLVDGPQKDSIPPNQNAVGTNNPANVEDNHGLHPDLLKSHISVLRPNTMVVTATTEFTVAKRSVFLRHFAKELENANGQETINSMVQLCSRTMSLHHDEDSRRQAPTTYDLLRQPVYLPRSVALDKKRIEDTRKKSEYIYLSLLF